MTEATHIARASLAILSKFFAGDDPLVATLEEVQKLREFNHDSVMRGSLKGAIVIYGAPVVDAEGKTWEWTDEQE